MNLFTVMLTTIALLSSSSTEAQTLVITRGGTRPISPAPAETFTGTARVEMLFQAVDPAHASGGSVTFEPGARTAWHSHPAGQILIVTAGVGRVQLWAGPIQEIRTGDVVTIPAGQKHWHGASPQASMTHIAVTEARDGTAVQWMEKVSDEQYNGAHLRRLAQGDESDDRAREDARQISSGSQSAIVVDGVPDGCRSIKRAISALRTKHIDQRVE